MVKALLRKLIPGSKRLAKLAADRVQQSINGTNDDTRRMIARYSALAHEATEIANQLTDWLKDGDIDDVERDAMAALLEPAMAKVKELI